MEGQNLPGKGGRVIYLTRRAEFSASHYYHNPSFSAEENQRVFGKPSNPHGHGHNYTVEVTVAGEVDPATGMVINIKELKKALEDEVLSAMDHKFLNAEVPEFAASNPTTENIAVAIWRRLAPKLTRAKLHRVRLYETPDLYADYFGD